jgi:uncharacterized integral membrane protein
VFRIVVYFLVVAVMIIFASQNMDVVTVYVVAGSPIQIPLIVVIGMSFFGGFIFALMTVIRKAVKRKNRRSEMAIMEPRHKM